MEESVVFTFPCETNGNHATALSTIGHVISERHWKSTFGTECPTMRLISHFSLKLYIQF